MVEVSLTDFRVREVLKWRVEGVEAVLASEAVWEAS